MTAEQQAHAPATHAPDRNLALELARVTEAAAPRAAMAPVATAPCATA